ncbi:MAG: O-antigen ligase family protein [Betaproteobacteria bacterium]|jgi:O-antigen ligase
MIGSPPLGRATTAPEGSETAYLQGPDRHFRIILLILLLSPILGWNGIIVALIVAFRHFLRTPIDASIAQSSRSFWMISLVFLGYYATCVLTDLFHPPHEGYWNQFEVLIPLLTALYYLAHRCKIIIPYETLVSTARHVVLIIFILTGLEYLYFSEIRQIPWHRSALLAGNTLHVSHWLPTLTLFSIGFLSKNDKLETLKSTAILVLSEIALLYFMQARTSLLILLLLGTPVILMQVVHQINFQWVSGKFGRYIALGIAYLTLISSINWLMTHHAPERLRLVFASGFNIEEIARKDISLETRIEYWKAGIQALKEQPIYGHGSGQEYQILKKYVPTEFSYHRHAHQQFISFGIAGGFLAIIFGALLIFSPVIYGLMNREYVTRSIHLTVFLAIPVMLNAMTDSLLTNERHVAIFFLFFTIVFSVRQRSIKIPCAKEPNSVLEKRDARPEARET